MQNFAKMLSNIFMPLLAVSLAPESNPMLSAFLKLVVAFDSVDVQRWIFFLTFCKSSLLLFTA